MLPETNSPVLLDKEKYHRIFKNDWQSNFPGGKITDISFMYVNY